MMSYLVFRRQWLYELRHLSYKLYTIAKCEVGASDLTSSAALKIGKTLDRR